MKGVARQEAKRRKAARAEKDLGAVLLFGPPGVGKGTQAREISKRLEIPAVSTGDMIREEIDAGTKLGRTLKEILARGKLVSDDVVNNLVEERLAKPDARGGFLLDGYPRTPEQAEWLESLLEQLGRTTVVIRMEIGYNELVKRITGRRLCPNCGAIYNIYSHPPKTSDVCDICGSRLTVRSDDRAEVLEERLRAYERQTLPVFTVFEKNGHKVHAVDGSRSPQKVREQIFDILKCA